MCSSPANPELEFHFPRKGLEYAEYTGSVQVVGPASRPACSTVAATTLHENMSYNDIDQKDVFDSKTNLLRGGGPR